MNDNQYLNEVGSRIREARKKKGIKQGELANQIGKTQEALSDIENGTRALRLTELKLIAEALETPISYLAEDKMDILIAYNKLTPSLKAVVNEIVVRILNIEVRLIYTFFNSIGGMGVSEAISADFNLKNVHSSIENPLDRQLVAIVNELGFKTEDLPSEVFRFDRKTMLEMLEAGKLVFYDPYTAPESSSKKDNDNSNNKGEDGPRE
jgi:transcriptional regulator with XRE-family HTH domain